MDVYKAIRELQQEKRRLDALIASLESTSKGGSGRRGKTRGRKSMGAAERKAVSQRMVAYWAARRAGRPSPHAEDSEEPASEAARAEG